MKNLILAVIAIIFMAHPLSSEIPFGQALGVYEFTKDEYKHISPFWGMVALHGGMLKNLRFFGNYTADDSAKDSIAQLIKRLFPSPDGVQFVANANNQDPVGDLGRNLDRLNGIIEGLVSSGKEGPKHNIILNQLKGLDKNTKTKVQNEFVDLLLNAYEDQGNLANPKIPDNQLYPKDIVIISLLAFFAKVADSKADVKRLPFLMKDDFNDTNRFTRDDYFLIRKTMGTAQELGLLSHEPKDVERAFLMAIGYEKYENPFPQPIEYRAGVCVKDKVSGFPDCGETSLRNILMLLLSTNNIIAPERLEGVRNNIIPMAGVNLGETPFKKIMDYFLKYPSLEDASLSDAHNDWAAVVSELNEKTEKIELEDIQYGRVEKGEKRLSYEIKSNFSPIGVNGIINMLNVIGKILPDKKLNEPWPKIAESNMFDETKGFKQAAEKFTRFCEILSTEDHQISWENSATHDQTIDSYFPTIAIKVNERDAYDWLFLDGHFQINPKASDNNDWRLQFANIPEQDFINEWMASLYIRLDTERFIDNDTVGDTFPRALLFGSHATLRSLDNALKAISFILYRNYKDKTLTQFTPLIAHIIDRSVHLNDAHSLKLISYLLFSAQMANINVDHIVQQFKEIHQRIDEMAKNPNLNDIARSICNSGPDMGTALIWLNTNPNFNELKASRWMTNSIVKNLFNLTSLDFSDNETITDEGLKNLRNLTSLNLSRNNEITDDGIEKLTSLTSLNTNNEITDEGIKNLRNLTSLNLSRNNEITDDGIEKLTSLTSLNTNNKITDEGIKNLRNLTSLDLSHNNKITDEGIKNLRNLTSLDLSYNNKISNAGIENLTGLTSLNLSNNSIFKYSKISDAGLKNLTSLTSLNLTENKMITAAGLKNLISLTSLNLTRNITINCQDIKLLPKSVVVKW